MLLKLRCQAVTIPSYSRLYSIKYVSYNVTGIAQNKSNLLLKSFYKLLEDYNYLDYTIYAIYYSIKQSCGWKLVIKLDNGLWCFVSNGIFQISLSHIEHKIGILCTLLDNDICKMPMFTKH